MYVTAYNQSAVFFNILPCLCLVFSLYVEEAAEYVLCSDSFMAICKTSLWKYVFCFLQSDLFFSQLREVSGTTTINQLTQNNFNGFLIPIPPYSEQERIFEQLNAILPLIETYSNQQENIDAINNSIRDRLKKSILQEAIKGGLLPQIAEEGTAENLLAEIRKEKQKLLKEGKLKKKDFTESVIFKGDDNKYYERIGAESIEIELPFSFPESWEIVKLHSICALIDGEKRTGNYICLDAKYLRGKSSGEQMTEGRFVHSGDNIILVDGENSGEVFTAPIDGYMGSTFKQLWVSETLHLPYVLACIRFYKDELRNSKKGAAIPHLNKDIFRNLIIGIPPLQEQERIIYKFNEIEKQF